MTNVLNRPGVHAALFVGVPTLAVALLIAAGLWTRTDSDTAFAEQVVHVPIGDWRHVVSAVDYDTTTPAGGDHRAGDAICGFFNEPVPSDRAVGSLAAGAVWIAYRPGLSDDDQARLEQLAVAPETLISPVDDLSAPVVATAWSRQLALTTAYDGQLDRFVREYAANTFSPEAGQVCPASTE